MNITPIDRLRTLPVHKDNEAWEVGLIELTPPATPPRSRLAAPAPTGSDTAPRAEARLSLPKLVAAVCVSTTKEGAACVEPTILRVAGQPPTVEPLDDAFPLRAIAACALDPHTPGVRPWNYLPARIHVGTLPPAMKQCLDEFFGPLGVIIEVKPRLERVESMQEILENLKKEEAEHGEIPYVPPIMDRPGMTLERVRAFAQAARVFYDARPWRHAADTHDLWEIQPPPPWTELGYCTLMGDGGEVFGLAFYESPEQFMECLRVGETNSPQAVLSMPGAHWAITLDTANEAPPADLLLWKRESLPTAGKDHRIPAPMAFANTDASPEPTILRPSPEQLTHMEAVLRAFAKATRRAMDDGFFQHTVPTFSGPRSIALAAIEWPEDDDTEGGSLAGQVFDLSDPELALEKIITKLGDSPDADKLRRLLNQSKAARKSPPTGPPSSAKAKKPKQGRTWVYVGPEKADAVYQFKVTLDGLTPPIWRRLLIRDDSTFEELHTAIQMAFGWTNSHMHEFCLVPERAKPAPGVKLSREQKWERRAIERFAERRFTGNPDRLAVDSMFGGDDGEPTHTVQINSLNLTPKSNLKYTYDFGDSWEHSVILEKVLATPDAEELIAAAPHAAAVWKRFTKTTRTPIGVLLDGERAGPLEDCGGVWGYAELCQIMADPKHPDHAERKEWTEEYASNSTSKGGFDPERIDLLSVNKTLTKYLRRC